MTSSARLVKACMYVKVLLTRLWPDTVIQAMRERYEITVDLDDRPLSPSVIGQAMTQFDAICSTITDRFDAPVLNQRDSRVRIIGNFGAGFEHIDLAVAQRAGIVVTNTPDVLTQSTAELCLLLMLMTARRAGEGERQLRAGRWPGWHPNPSHGS